MARAKRKTSTRTNPKPKFPSQANLSKLVTHVKDELKTYPDDYIDYDDPDYDPDWSVPTIQLTVGADGEGHDDWGWQTGDNSYTGGAYGYQNWAVVSISVDETNKEIVDDILNQLHDLHWQ